MAPAIELTYDAWMGRALELAREVGAAGDVPVGALVVDPDGEVIGVGANLREVDGDPTGHAEIVAMRRAAASRGGWRPDGCTPVVTLEPCLNSAGATVQALQPRHLPAAAAPNACPPLTTTTTSPHHS
ncbi:nucleoside deaminase, partial [Listeria monocytogenes]|uniref:nucleoside deaminase n=1 Tax=Listeria monocytogenes TaxID=1639 RepID=UPI0021AD6DF2